MVDRSPRLDRLFFCILFAALYLAVSVLVVKHVAYAFLEQNLALGALLASATLFFVPLTLLAAVGLFSSRIWRFRSRRSGPKWDGFPPSARSAVFWARC
jgi:hypothetical protein